jgi:hypothetical protein
MLYCGLLSSPPAATPHTHHLPAKLVHPVTNKTHLSSLLLTASCHLAQAAARGLMRAGDRVVVSQCPRVNEQFPVMAEAGVVKILTIDTDGKQCKPPVPMDSFRHHDGPACPHDERDLA